MRLALGVSYNGQPYLGWQSQPSGQTIQDQLEKALSQFCDQRVLTHCAGRTDTGVHGLMQVVHLDTPLARDMHSWVRGTNRYLPADIAVQWVKEMPGDFHARGSAVARRYVYVLLESPVRPALESGRVGWSFRPLDEAAMREAAQHLAGCLVDVRSLQRAVALVGQRLDQPLDVAERTGVGDDLAQPGHAVGVESGVAEVAAQVRKALG